eukprot:4787371-Amphidinium_carterae.1
MQAWTALPLLGFSSDSRRDARAFTICLFTPLTLCYAQDGTGHMTRMAIGVALQDHRQAGACELLTCSPKMRTFEI